MPGPDTKIPHAPVAIVMRTKERPMLLRRALRDVLRQGYQTWHLVLVNDGGDRAAVDGLVAEHAGDLAGRITVLHNEESRGKEPTSNQAIHASSSAYVAIHDDDDSWHPDFLARTVAHLEACADAGVTVRTEIIWERIEKGNIIEQGREIFCPDIHEFTLFELIRHNRMVPISVLYRRSVHEDVGYYREDLLEVGDWEFLLRLAVDHEMGFLGGEPLAFWHQRHDQDGFLGNSVIFGADEHRRFDLLVRNAALQEHVRRHGMGGVLYLTKYIDRRMDEILGLLREQNDLSRELNELSRELEVAISDASLVSLLRRRYRRLKGRFVDGPP